jgi:large subunit ribosomal protein L29
MTAEKLRESETAELEKQSGDLEEQIFRIKFQMSIGQMEGLKKYRELKKDRARILGIITERKSK